MGASTREGGCQCLTGASEEGGWPALEKEERRLAATERKGGGWPQRRRKGQS